MEVRAKKSLGQHFLTDQDIARRIVESLQGTPVLEVGPGMGVLTRYLISSLAGQPLELAASGQQLRAIEIDKESVAYLKKHFPELGDGLIEGDFLKMDLTTVFPGQFSIIGNFPYNISSQIFFKIIDNRDLIMIARYLVGLVEFNEKQMEAADFNEDGIVNNTDLVLIARYIVAQG